MSEYTLQVIIDENGNKTNVVVPIDLWREIESERETAFLLKSKPLKNACWKPKAQAPVSHYQLQIHR